MLVHIVPAVGVAALTAPGPLGREPARSATRQDEALTVEWASSTRCSPSVPKHQPVSADSARAATPRPRSSESTQ